MFLLSVNRRLTYWFPNMRSLCVCVCVFVCVCVCVCVCEHSTSLYCPESAVLGFTIIRLRLATDERPSICTFTRMATVLSRLPCQITVRERVPCLSNIFRSPLQRGFANADFQIFTFPPFIVSSANRDFSFYVSAFFNFSLRKKRVPSTLTSFYTHTTFIAITNCPAETSFPRKVSRYVRLPRFMCLSVNVYISWVFFGELRFTAKL